MSQDEYILGWDFQLIGMDMKLRLDVFNLSNRDGVIEVDEHADLVSGAANPYFRAPTEYQQPRRIRLGFGLSF